MYYNIKIKSNGSEFSLESGNKEVTEKEMDAYFACILGASEEFKSTIKKTIIVKENLKSINDLEELSKTNVTKQSEEVVQQNISELSNQAAQQETAQVINEPPVQILKKLNIPEYTEIEKQPAPQVVEEKIQETTKYTEPKIEEQPTIQTVEMPETFEKIEDSIGIEVAPQVIVESIQKEESVEVPQITNQPEQKNTTQTASNTEEPRQTLEQKIEQIATEKALEMFKARELERIKHEQENIRRQQEINELLKQQEELKLELQKRQEEVRIQQESLKKQLEIQQTIAKENETQTPIELDNAREVISFKNNTTDSMQAQTILLQTEIQDNDESVQNEINELINLAQEKINSFEIEENTDNKANPYDNQQRLYEEIVDLKSQSSLIPEEAHNDSFEASNTAKLNDIFNTPKNESSQNTNDVGTIAVTNEPNVVLSEVELDIQPQEMENIQPQIQNDNQSQVQISNQIEIQNQPQESTPNQTETYDSSSKEQELIQTLNEEQEQENNKRTSTIPALDFKPFLASFACNELTDQFIICAYFIKNVLKQTDFTMKFINSKLFQATNKIADMSVLDELITKEYIRVIESDETKKYTITMDGEAYFANLLQG